MPAKKVKAEQLEGKVIGIYFLSLTKDREYTTLQTELLKDIYDDLHPENNFEVVLVACMVLQYLTYSWYILADYGALGYPFSDKRLKFLRTEDYLASQQPSLKTLLGSSQRDYVISNNGAKVPIHTLEEKVVALYFYNPDCPDSLTKELKSAYEEFAKLKKIFEVVLVYIREPCNNENCLEVEIEKLKGLNLGKLWNPEHVFKRTDGSQALRQIKALVNCVDAKAPALCLGVH
ncbi:uncharacterized protein LOC141661285 [Apium graveolens]|uniref:uncharacterized protein LOC141661285 n=1 Tax=Apium graveolens TaxID=4045 RepID=UPI003D7B0236